MKLHPPPPSLLLSPEADTHFTFPQRVEGLTYSLVCLYYYYCSIVIIVIIIIVIIIIIIIIVRLAPFQCIALLAASNLQSGLSSASLVASSTLRSFFIVANHAKRC